LSSLDIAKHDAKREAGEGGKQKDGTKASATGLLVVARAPRTTNAAAEDTLYRIILAGERRSTKRRNSYTLTDMFDDGLLKVEVFNRPPKNKILYYFRRGKTKNK